VKKLTLSVLALALAAGIAATGAEAKSKGKAQPKPTGQAAAIAACKKNTDGIYTFDQRVFTYGNCVQKLNYYGKNMGYAAPPGYAAR
jgi:uncharacterized protein with FMN-binding domain